MESEGWCYEGDGGGEGEDSHADAARSPALSGLALRVGRGALATQGGGGGEAVLALPYLRNLRYRTCATVLARISAQPGTADVKACSVAAARCMREVRVKAANINNNFTAKKQKNKNRLSTPTQPRCACISPRTAGVRHYVSLRAPHLPMSATVTVRMG